MSALDRIRERAAAHRLFVSGIAPDGAGSVVLLSPDEPDFWLFFQDSREARDGAADPLDRWSERVIGGLAHAVGGEAVFPFGGPPWHPFPGWALGSGRVWTSPVGFMVHDTAGLFISYRGGIRLAEVAAEEVTPAAAPCEDCAKPCLRACPVDAFGSGTYDVPACRSYLATSEGSAGCGSGCAVRRACPVGAGRRVPEQSAFHMEAFARR